MSSADIYVLSSSPTQTSRSCANISSSPELPSPSQLLRRLPPKMRTGCCATSIPAHSAGFTSVARLLAKGSLDYEGLEGLEDIPSNQANIQKDDIPQTIASSENALRPSAREGPLKLGGKSAKGDMVATEPVKSKPVRKPRAKKADIGDKEQPKGKVTRKPRPKKSDIVVVGDEKAIVKEKGARKPRAKKDTETQTKLRAGRITKNTGAKPAKPTKAETLLSEAVSKHFSSKVEPMAEDEGLMLEKAVKRRNSWTPPTATTITHEASLTTPLPLNLLDARLTSGGSIVADEKCQNFSELLGNYGFTKTKEDTPRKVSDGSVTRKRKLIEFITAPLISSETAAVKPKAIKKKPRTITEQATAVYAGNHDDSIQKTAPLLQYFSVSSPEGGADQDGFKLPTKSRSRSPTKPAPKKSKAKKCDPEPILLSPASALKQVDTQDFVFGTSSQLAREESPTFLRDLHQALQASNEVGADPFLEDPFEEVLQESLVSAERNSQDSETKRTKRNLWSAASRGEDGELLEVETIDLVDSPVANRVRAELEKQNPGFDHSDLSITKEKTVSVSNEHQKSEVPLRRNEEQHLESLSDSENIVSEEPKAGTRKIGPIEAAILLELSSPSTCKSPARSKAAKTTSPVKAPAKRGRKSQAKSQEKPDFSTFTDAQLSKEVASYHFKPIKKREAMIDLLEKCWESKQRMALVALGTNKLISKSAANPAEVKKAVVPDASSPKRPRGRPRKDDSLNASSVAKPRGRPKKIIEEAEFDSDTPLSKLMTPKKSQRQSSKEASPRRRSKSPPRRAGSRPRTPPLTLSLSADNEVSPTLSPGSTQVRLFSHITSAVKQAPRATDSLNPGWYEKILLYDPIILEDLTVWLNTGALEKVGWDGEVAPWEVKKWCESRSICCLWKDNLRGGNRSRY
ncbi:Structure-specific endonuclease subunit SLX4 [Phlyctema vagabunda]|uniref:Structure-specific endonuclease subunit SLX4 n=1 Tax=Phlyctema vagabunda TaxID=108571 RepID=A0ABR4PPL0_9HELO